jgi:hypothetical protein
MQLTSSDWITIGVGIIGFIAGGIISWLIALRFRERRYTELSWELVSSTPLTDPLRVVRGGTLEVLLDGERVENIHLLLVRIICSGQLPVQQYTTPISMAIKEQEEKPATLHRAIVTEKSSDNVLVDVTERTTQAAVLAKVPLNAGDWYTVQLLVSQEVNQIKANAIEVSGSIIGVSARPIRYYVDPRGKSFGRWVAAWLTLGVSLIILSVMGIVFHLSPFLAALPLLLFAVLSIRVLQHEKWSQGEA